MNDSKGKRERRETSRESRLPATHTTPRLWSDWINKRKVLFIYSLKRRKSILKSIHNTLYTEWNERNVRVFCFRRFTLLGAYSDYYPIAFIFFGVRVVFVREFPRCGRIGVVVRSAMYTRLIFGKSSESSRRRDLLSVKRSAFVHSANRKTRRYTRKMHADSIWGSHKIFDIAGRQ